MCGDEIDIQTTPIFEIRRFMTSLTGEGGGDNMSRFNEEELGSIQPHRPPDDRFPILLLPQRGLDRGGPPSPARQHPPVHPDHGLGLPPPLHTLPSLEISDQA